MSSALFTAVCSITATRRRRFLWAAWWTGAPSKQPFRRPDAFEGGARTREEAKRAAEAAAGTSLLEIESSWARAWSNVLVGKAPWAGARDEEKPIRARGSKNNASVWEILGLKPSATLTEIKSAYRKRALEAHPDRGGSAERFRALQTAYESALTRRGKKAKPG
ncbi:MAG TPA: J domain-containing protein [Polyangiaceae bacterium]|jgi:hypothetical protein